MASACLTACLGVLVTEGTAVAASSSAEQQANTTSANLVPPTPRSLLHAGLEHRTTIDHFAPSPGEADVTSAPSSNAPTAVKFTLNAGIGPTVGFGGGALGRLAFDGQYRLFGSDAGPAIGGMIHLLFGQNTFGMQLGPIFMWEFFLADPGGIRIYVGPVAATGYGFQHVSVNGFSGTANYWYLNLGAQGRAMFNDRFGAFIRPLNFDITAGQGGAGGSWSLILGGSMDF